MPATLEASEERIAQRVADLLAERMGLEPDELLDKRQVAQYLRIGYRTVFRYVKQHNFPSPVVTEGREKWRKSDLKAWR